MQDHSNRDVYEAIERNNSHSHILEEYGSPIQMALTIEELRSEIEALKEKLENSHDPNDGSDGL